MRGTHYGRLGWLALGVWLGSSACAHQARQTEVAASLTAIAKDLLDKGQSGPAHAVLENARKLDPDSPEIARLLTPAAAAAPDARAKPPAGQALPAARRVALPYRYARHGVEVEVSAIERQPTADGPPWLVVDVTTRELRGRDIHVSWPEMLEARSPEGPLAFGHFVRRGKSEPGPQMLIAPGAQDQVSLLFQGAPNGGPVELRFPTGKWWRSE